MDPAEGWKLKLAQELQAAGFDFDPARVLRDRLGRRRSDTAVAFVKMPFEQRVILAVV
jgi:hypothetical protein